MISRLRNALRFFATVVPFRIVPAAITSLVLLLLLALPAPTGITPDAWTLVAIFLTTIVAIILK